MKPTLCILAAGMGSRYGSLKQLDGVGPAGETIIDYSVYDAIEAGFGKVVFVIRESFSKDFKTYITKKFEDRIEVVFVFQEVDVPVEGIEHIPPRVKPWGTAHAVLMAQDVIREPFAVINADDFYGASSFQVVADFLRNEVSEDHYAMVGFVLKNTLSDNGSVSRGVCQTDDHNYLSTIVERTKIQRENGSIYYYDGTQRSPLADDTVVSMNFFGFHPNIFEATRQHFIEFVRLNSENPKSEFYIPLVVNDLIQKERIKMTVLTSQEKWYGVTYKEDRPSIQSALQKLTDSGNYPHPLWRG